MAEGHQVVDRVISIHALREEGDEGRHSSQQRISISIHALREEGDGPLSCAAVVNDRISIHALREEGDRFALPFRFPPIKFLSTPSARRATKRLEGLTPIQKISIHALREEGDCSS